MRAFTYDVVEGGQGVEIRSRIFDAALMALILLNVAAFALETVPSYEKAYANWFHVFEVFSVAIFSIEYVLRLWTAIEVPFLQRMPKWRARLKFASSPALIIDLLAILPFYLALWFPMDLRLLRVFRLFRFLKLTRYSPAMHTLVRVLYNERRSLAGAGMLLAAALLLTSTGMYYIEHRAQPEKFGSIPETAYWAMTTLTTVGYGDATPITPLGKLFAMFTMLIGLCVLALPVAIISTGFAQEVGRRDFVITWSLMSRIPFLAKLDANEVAEIIPLLHAHNFPPGVEVIAEGSRGDAMFFIAAGRVECRKTDDCRVFETGDFFGAFAMIHEDENQSSFRARSKCRLLKLYKADFRRLESISPTIASHIRTVADARKAARDDADRKPKSEIVIDA